MPDATAPTSLHLIYARAANGVIGKDNRLPWHLPEDLAHFKQTTLGCPVIMGRKTWDSLPPKFRPLPGRLNIVVTRDAAWQAEGAVVAHSIEAAREACAGHPVAWVIGGAEVYAQSLPLAQEVVVTEIARDYEGDAFAPTLGPDWQVHSRDCRVNGSGLPYCFVRYRRNAA